VEIRQKGERGFSTLLPAAQDTCKDNISQMKRHCSTGTVYCIAPPASLTRAYEKTGLAVVKSKKEITQGSTVAMVSFYPVPVSWEAGWGCCFCQDKGLRHAELAPPGGSTPLPKISRS